MSLGVNDIATIARLLAILVDKIRNGPQEFREFTADLLLAQSCIRQIEAHQTDFSTRTARLGHLDRETTIAVFRDIQAGLAELQQELDGHLSQNRIGRTLDYVIAERQRVLREKLQFHFSKLGILYQSFSLAQGARMAEALKEIRSARVYDDKEEDLALTESIVDFRKKYVDRGGLSASAREADVEAVSSVMTGYSKDRLVRQWMSDVAKFEKGTYFDGFSDVGAGEGVPGNQQIPPPPSRAFLWQFMLWDIRHRGRYRRLAMVLGFVPPVALSMASFVMSPFLIWTARGIWTYFQ